MKELLKIGLMFLYYSFIFACGLAISVAVFHEILFYLLSKGV